VSVGWVAATVRARALARRRVGGAGAVAIARAPSYAAGRAALITAPYNGRVGPDDDLATAERNLAESLLWHLRVLSGWLPPDGGGQVRALAAGFELGNVDEHLWALRSGGTAHPYQLGGLATAWPRIAVTTSPEELRAVLVASPWGDPGDARPETVRLSLRLSWLRRLAVTSPLPRGWAVAAAALLVAGEVFAAGRPLPPEPRRAAGVLLGGRAVDATSLAELAGALPAGARWVLDGVERAEDLWAAEASFYRRAETDSFALLRQPGVGPRPVLGAVALLAVDVWRVRAALETAARGGERRELLDALA